MSRNRPHFAQMVAWKYFRDNRASPVPLLPLRTHSSCHQQRNSVTPSPPPKTPEPQSEAPMQSADISLVKLPLSPTRSPAFHVRARVNSISPDKSPPIKGRLIRRYAQESIYDDPQTRKVCVTVPSPRKLPCSRDSVEKDPAAKPPVLQRVVQRAVVFKLQQLRSNADNPAPPVVHHLYCRKDSIVPVKAEGVMSVRGKGLDPPSPLFRHSP